MPVQLVVTQQFADRQIGDIITDKDEMKGILASENAQRVVAVNAPVAPSKDAG